MRIPEISQLTDSYDHVYLSPHLDDAVLSCGGAIARHTSQGARVLVVTLCTATPPAAGPFSDFAAAMHGRWNLSPEQVVSARLHEDLLALERIGSDSYWANMPDAIYRMPDSYTSNATLLGLPVASDPQRQRLMSLFDELHARLPRATFYVPLAIGGHVDHRLVYEATLAGGWGHSSAYYEDIPYVLARQALERRMQELQREFVPSIIDIDDHLNRKLGAIACYGSQLHELFEGEEQMRARVTAYHETLRPETGTYGERVWVMV